MRSRGTRDRFAVSEFNGISLRALHSARAVTQVHGECIGRTVNRGPPPSRSAILDFCFICLRQSGCSSLSSPIISWARAFLFPTFYLSPKRMARVSKRITDRRVLLNVSPNRVPKCTIYLVYDASRDAAVIALTGWSMKHGDQQQHFLKEF